MDSSNETPADFTERLSNLKEKLNNTDEACLQLHENVKFIKEKKSVWNNENKMDPSMAAYIPLHFSNHRELIRILEFIVKFGKNSDQQKGQYGQDNSRLKTLLDKSEMAFHINGQMCQELQNTVTELKKIFNKIQLVSAVMMNDQNDCNSM